MRTSQFAKCNAATQPPNLAPLGLLPLGPPSSVGFRLCLPRIPIIFTLGIEHPEHGGVLPFPNDLAERGGGAPDVVQHPALNLGLEWRLATVRQPQRVERIDH